MTPIPRVCREHPKDIAPSPWKSGEVNTWNLAKFKIGRSLEIAANSKSYLVLVESVAPDFSAPDRLLVEAPEDIL